MYSRREVITPEIAKEYLEHNVLNRKVRPDVVKRYASDMRRGNWQLTPQGISFYENGSLADGQHRLLAVIESGCTAEIWVTYEVPNECTIQDRGAKRDTSDILRLNKISSVAATTNGVSTINYLFSICGRHGVVSDTTIKDFITDGNNEQILCDTLSICGTRQNKMQLLRKAPIMAAFFCALYCGIPEDCLKKFAQIVNSGFTTNPAEQSAIVLRNYMIQNFSNRNTAERRFAFIVATNAIKDFAAGNPRQKVYRADTEPAFLKHVKKNAVNKFFDK